MDGTKKLIIAVVAVIILTIVGFVLAKTLKVDSWRWKRRNRWSS